MRKLFKGERKIDSLHLTAPVSVKNLAYAAVGTKVKKDLMAGNAVVIFAYGPYHAACLRVHSIWRGFVVCVSSIYASMHATTHVGIYVCLLV